ncbi:MAG: prepilin peptidase [Candidatus Acidiferrum sp.]
MIPFFFFLFGIVIGSFLNVCISRIPEGNSIISPGSRCPRCEKPIKPYDNIPILSWLVLRGKCRNCHLPISPMYPIVEFLTGAIFVLTYYEFGVTLFAFKWLFFACLLIILCLTDLRTRLLPDAVNWFGFGFGLALAVGIPLNDVLGAGLLHWIGLSFLPPPAFRVLHSLLAPLLFSGFLWLFGFAYWLWKKREGLGLGDVKMIAMIGVFLGIEGTLLTLLVGSLLGVAIGVPNFLLRYALGWKRGVAERANRRGLGSVRSVQWEIARRYQIPFGTFLGIGALLVVYTLPWLGISFLYGYPVLRP